MSSSPEDPMRYTGDARLECLIRRQRELLKRGVEQSTMLAELLTLNQECCAPPLELERIELIVAMPSAESSAEDERDQTVMLNRILAAHAAEPFAASDGIGYVAVKMRLGDQASPIIRTFAIDEGAFSRWLAYQYYRQRFKAASGYAIGEVQRTLQGRAQFEGPIRDVAIRVGGTRERVVLDLGEDDCPPIVVDQQGWRFDPEPAVYFRRPPGLLSLPAPTTPRRIEELRLFLNLDQDEDFVLVVCWCVQALLPVGPYPLLVAQGEQGSAKSTTLRLVRALIDPNAATIRSHPNEERDLMIAARNGWILAYDNLSRIPQWLSDALCRIATGGGSARRALYSNFDEVIINVQRPTMLNGIEELATRGDLMDRCIVIELPRLKPQDRRLEEDLYRDFEEIRPALLATLLDAVSTVIRERDRVNLVELPRMADFARVGTAAEKAFDWKPGTFMRAYDRNRQRANETVIHASAIGLRVIELVQKGAWRGTASALLTKLEGTTLDVERRHFGWPKSPLALANMLRRLAPALRLQGIRVDFNREGKAGERVIHIRPADDLRE